MPLLWLSLSFIAGIVLAANIKLSTAAWLGFVGASLVLSIFLRLLNSRFNRSPNPDRPITNHLLSRQPCNLTIVGGILRFTRHFLLITQYVLRFIASPPYSLLLLFLFLGAVRYQSAQPDLGAPDFIASHNDSGEWVSLTGTLVKPPEIADGYSDLRILAEQIRLEGQQEAVPVRGLVMARIWEEGDWHYGDRLLLEGRLATPPEFVDFSYRDYLARQGVYSQMQNARATLISSGGGSWTLRLIYTYREHALDAVYRLWPDPEASLFGGILLGAEGGIAEEVYQAFRDTGTAHVIVISGFNITILAGMLVVVFSRLLGRGQLGVRRAVVVAFAGIFLYAVLVGGEAAVVRAAIMGVVGLFGSLVGRRQAGLNTLAFVAGGMAAVSPNVLWDVGFQLSFAATLGLVLYATPLQEAFVRLAARYIPQETAQKLARPVGEYFLFTLAAQVLVIPISLVYFQRLSVIALIANPLVLPAQPPLMVLGGLSVLVGTVYLPLGQVLAWMAWPFAAYTIRIVELLAKTSEGAIALGGVSLSLVVAYYAGVFALTFAAGRLKGLASRVAPGVALAGLLALTALAWRAAFAAPDGRLHLTVLDVGQGDGLLIQTPGGRAVLIDGGPSTERLSDQLGRRLPLGRRELDWLVVAAAGEEQIGGLSRNLERFPPANVLWAGPMDGTDAGRELHAALAEAGVQPIQAQAGQVLDLGEGAKLRILEAGELGATLLLEWGDFRALLPVGVDFETLETLMEDRSLAGITALLLAQSGYAPVNPREWIEQLSPQVALLSVAEGDRHGLPSAETLQAVHGFNLLRTDTNGWIELTTDGEQMWVEVEKK
jgi:competence protein ComEC